MKFILLRRLGNGSSKFSVSLSNSPSSWSLFAVTESSLSHSSDEVSSVAFQVKFALLLTLENNDAVAARFAARTGLPELIFKNGRAQPLRTAKSIDAERHFPRDARIMTLIR